MKKQFSSSKSSRWLIAMGIGAAAAALVYARRQRIQRGRRWRSRLESPAEKTALVTGASAGIGRAFTLQLAARKYNLVLVARREERLKDLACECRSRFNVQAEVLPADLSTEAGIARVEQRIGEPGGVDFLVNNAGYDVFGSIAEIPVEKAVGLINCLEMATVRLTRAALPGMLERRRGAVINVSSIGAFGPKRSDTLYVASKTFVNRFTESLALELKDSGVRVQALCPGFTLTEFHDAPEFEAYHVKDRIPRWLWMTPDEVACDALRAIEADRVIHVPGFKNQMIAAAGRSGLSQLLMKILASFFREARTRYTQPASVLDLIACPHCHGPLDLQGTLKAGLLVCKSCAVTYPITGGIPRFVEYRELSGLNRRFAGLYDLFSAFYRLSSKVAFAYIGTTEDEARHEILDRLEPCGGRVLEVSVGPGVNLPYLWENPAVREVYALDLSAGQIAQCRRFVEKQGQPAALFQGNAEELPFRDGAFESVFHIGGINFFSNKKKAIDEMVRVAKPGAKIVICDETERAARGYELTLPGFKRSFQSQREPVKPPRDLVPAEMLDVRVDETVWKGWFYCLEFRKPD